MYPNKVDASGNPWKLPFLPGKSVVLKVKFHWGIILASMVIHYTT